MGDRRPDQPLLAAAPAVSPVPRLRVRRRIAAPIEAGPCRARRFPIQRRPIKVCGGATGIVADKAERAAMTRGSIKKIVLAYSGGLDTSVILKWLQETYRCEVVTFTADLGQGEELEPARKKAEMFGVKEIFIEDLREE